MKGLQPVFDAEAGISCHSPAGRLYLQTHNTYIAIAQNLRSQALAKGCVDKTTARQLFWALHVGKAQALLNADT